ncbi:hypothetical protein DEM27_23800 [Metarhizobium album]|uniref:Uncharacterized protein n=1 Tax=Metarhizobium album TaxID=2182425 RepID=A0A2U2DKV5_9HYPH|nr:hypothetical protein [Rhizobium album]PWE53938.1 hypothetical protein DEM27_23800 [Rhizobium album]
MSPWNDLLSNLALVAIATAVWTFGNSTLKSSSSSEVSSTGKLLELITEEFKKHDVETEVVRLTSVPAGRADVEEADRVKARATEHQSRRWQHS